jgi:hypothetical protein
MPGSAGPLPSAINVPDALLLAELQRARRALGWGASLGVALDREEIALTRRLRCAKISSAATAAAVLADLDGRRLLFLTCRQAELSVKQIQALQAWAMRKAGWIVLTGDVAKSIGFTFARESRGNTRAPLAAVRDSKTAPYVEGLPDSLGTARITAGTTILPTKKAAKAIVFLRATDRTGTADLGAVLPFGQGHVVFIALPIDRNQAWMSRLVFNIKKLAAGKP